MYSNPIALREPVTTVLATRGCPHGCSFCTARRTPFRRRSAGNVLAELEEIRSQGFKEVFFRDENLALDRAFARDLCEGMISRRLGLSWISNSRVDSVDSGLLALMARAGCHMLKFGVESGLQQDLNRMSKGTTIRRIMRAFAGCRAAGIETMAHVIVGLPWQRDADLDSCVEFVLSLEPTLASFDVFIPHPWTPLAGERPSISEGACRRAFRRFYSKPASVARAAASVRSWKRLRDYLQGTLELWRGLLDHPAA